MTLDTEDALELAWGDSCGDYAFVAKQHISKRCWYTRHLIVFEYAGDRLGFYYDEPATEEQEGQDSFDADPVPTFLVTAREITTTVYCDTRETEG